MPSADHRLNILGFDTSGPHVAIGWIDPATGRGQGRVEEMARGQAEALLPLLEECLGELGWGWGDLDAIGVGVGPGNFTGIRISVAAARGLALALDRPAIAIDNFELALPTLATPPNTCIALPAPREMAYIQAYDAQGRADPSTRQVIDPTDPPAAFSGMQIGGYRASEIAEALGSRTIETDLTSRPGVLAERTAEKATRPSAPPAPLYIKPADAAPAKDPPPVILDP